MKKMEGKVILITGAGKGIGYGVATAFAKEGANLAITGRTVERLKKAKDTLESNYGIKVLSIAADGGHEDDVKRAIEETIAEYGRLDCIINNAQASASGKMFMEHTKADFDIAINTGLYATFYYMLYGFPHLEKTKGCIINFASGAGLRGIAAQSSYAAAKEGIRGLSRVCATEFGPSGVRVNVVCPLAMTEQLKLFKENYPEKYAQTISGIPLGRFADPEKDIGRVCVFLASEDAGFISGETIVVQGGSSLRP